MRRFSDAMERYFLVVPDRWTGLQTFPTAWPARAGSRAVVGVVDAGGVEGGDADEDR